MINIKKQYYKMTKSEFDKYLDDLKNDSRTCRFFKERDKEYFFCADNECVQALIQLHTLQIQLDQMINSLSSNKVKCIKETLLIDEIKTTNATENIYSTRKNIFGLMNQISSIRDKKVKSILQAYQFIKQPEFQISDLYSIRNMYDVMMKDAFDSKEDQPDGKLFRKDTVSVTNGVQEVHKGFYPESEIIDGMEEYLSIYKNDEMDIYQRLILSHFLFETIHPFYDGNGRLGRLLFSMELLKKENSLAAYLVSSSINKNKKKYYDALENGREIHTFGCINTYFMVMFEILSEGFKDAYQDIVKRQSECQTQIEKSKNIKMSKSERKILEYLIEVSCFSYYGAINNDIIAACDVSKRTVITTINKFRSEGMIKDTKIGAFEYHKLIDIQLLKDE